MDEDDIDSHCVSRAFVYLFGIIDRERERPSRWGVLRRSPPPLRYSPLLGKKFLFRRFFLESSFRFLSLSRYPTRYFYWTGNYIMSSIEICCESSINRILIVRKKEKKEKKKKEKEKKKVGIWKGKHDSRSSVYGNRDREREREIRIGSCIYIRYPRKR